MENKRTHLEQNSILRHLESNECINEIAKHLLIVEERVQLNLNNLKQTATDIYNEFGLVTLKIITEALRQGSLGAYGKSYKLNTQEICIWIREYRNSKKQTML